MLPDSRKKVEWIVLFEWTRVVILVSMLVGILLLGIMDPCLLEDHLLGTGTGDNVMEELMKDPTTRQDIIKGFLYIFGGCGLIVVVLQIALAYVLIEGIDNDSYQDLMCWVFVNKFIVVFEIIGFVINSVQVLVARSIYAVPIVGLVFIGIVYRLFSISVVRNYIDDLKLAIINQYGIPGPERYTYRPRPPNSPA